MCNNSESTRKLLLPAGWLIFGATIALMAWNIFYILNYKKKEKNVNIKVGTGDNEDDYEDQSKGSYILGYVLWGSLILVFAILFICVAQSYLKTFEEEEKMEKDMMMEEEQAMMKDEMEAPADAAEGGSIEH